MKKNLPWIVTGFVLVLSLLQTCILNKRIEKGQEQITQLQLDNQTQKEIINKQGDTIQVQEAIITSSTKALDNLTDSIFDLKKKDAKNRQTIAYYKGITKAEIVEVGIPYLDEERMKFWEDSVKASCQAVIDYYERNSIPVPREAGDTTADYSFKATVRKDSLVIDKLSIPDTLQLRFVQHNGGLFKPDKIEVQYFHSNPLITSIQSNSVFYKPKKKSFFQRILLPVAVGIGTGIILSK